MQNETNQRTEQRTDVLIVGTDKIYGPFLDQEIAQGWLDNHRSIGAVKFFSYSERELGTTDTAHECGTLLQTIDEAVSTRSTSRRASGA